MNPAAIDLAHELKRFEWKVEAGAEYAITQPVFDVDAARALPRARSSTCAFPIIAGIWPLVSRRNAEFLANEVPGRRRAGRRSSSACGRANEKSKEHARRRRDRDRARDARARARRGPGCAGVGAVRQGRAGAAGVRRQSDQGVGSAHAHWAELLNSPKTAERNENLRILQSKLPERNKLPLAIKRSLVRSREVLLRFRIRQFSMFWAFFGS